MRSIWLPGTSRRVIAVSLPGHWNFRFLVALPLMRDLLLSAKHLFIAAKLCGMGCSHHATGATLSASASLRKGLRRQTARSSETLSLFLPLEFLSNAARRGSSWTVNIVRLLTAQRLFVGI